MSSVIKGFKQVCTIIIRFNPISFEDIAISELFRLSETDETIYRKINNNTFCVEFGSYDTNDESYPVGTYVTINPLQIVYIQDKPEIIGDKIYTR